MAGSATTPPTIAPTFDSLLVEAAEVGVEVADVVGVEVGVEVTEVGIVGLVEVALIVDGATID